ncbi:bacitracin ABC transporter ATP-binding protein [Bacillus sp. JJ1532]
MFKDNSPFLSDEFLDELAKEINQQYGGQTNEQNVEPISNDE